MMKAGQYFSKCYKSVGINWDKPATMDLGFGGKT